MATKKATSTTTKTKKKAAAGGDKGKRGPEPRHSKAYEAALQDYQRGLDLLRKGEYQAAIEQLKQVERSNADEPELADRARMYSMVCARKLAPPAGEPATSRERYYRAVVLANEGKLQESEDLLTHALREEPENPSLLYARSSGRALQGKTQEAVSDLRHAILLDPTIRYQAINDPDFEGVRDDAAFIDVIEPTTTGD